MTTSPYSSTAAGYVVFPGSAGNSMHACPLRIVQVVINENVGRPDAEAPIEIATGLVECAPLRPVGGGWSPAAVSVQHFPRGGYGKRSLPRPPYKTRTNHDFLTFPVFPARHRSPVGLVGNLIGRRCDDTNQER